MNSGNKVHTRRKSFDLKGTCVPLKYNRELVGTRSIGKDYRMRQALNTQEKYSLHWVTCMCTYCTYSLDIVLSRLQEVYSWSVLNRFPFRV